MITKTKEKYFLKEVVSKKLLKNESIGKQLSAILVSDVLGLDFDTVYNNIVVSTDEIAFSSKTVNSTADMILNNLDDKIIIDIEINGYNGIHKKNQILSYVCQLFLGQIKNNFDYLSINKVLQINIDNFDFLGKGDFMYDIYLMDKKYREIASNEIQIVHFNLDYLRELDYTIIKENELMKNLYVFVCGLNELDEFVSNCDGDNFMKKIVKEVKKISGEEHIIPYMTEDEMREFDRQYYGKIYREEGRKEGKREMIINLYQNNVSLDIISKSSGLSIKEIQKIIENNN